MSLKELNTKVLSYCEIPYHITENCWILNETVCDSYIEYKIDSFLEEQSELDKWIYNAYPELDKQEFLIHIDY